MSIPPGMENPTSTAAAPRLGRRDWQRAALTALTEGGLAAVTIPRLARKLGVTKGSFYWHFRGLDDLLQVALEDWERVFTDERLARFAATRDPRARLEPWFAETAADHPAQRLHIAIENAADHPVIGPIFARVTAKRADFIAAALAELGFPPATARARAVAALSAYLGYLRLVRHAPAVIGDAASRAEIVGQVVDILLGPRR